MRRRNGDSRPARERRPWDGPRAAVRAPASRPPSVHAPPRKRFAQHFLQRPWAERVRQAIAPVEGDVILEIGPGRGAITQLLAQTGIPIVACEIDRDLAAALRATVSANVRVVEGDFLAMSPSRLRDEVGPLADRLRVVGNLPYNVATPILFKLLDLHREGLPLVDATVMLQREVADRLLAAPGSKDYGALSVLVQREAKVERLLQLPPGAFRPQPRVHSTLVGLRFHTAGGTARAASFRSLTVAIFSRRRKTIANALAAYSRSRVVPPTDVLRHAGIDPRRRPETLTIQEIDRLVDGFSSADDPGPA